VTTHFRVISNGQNISIFSMVSKRPFITVSHSTFQLALASISYE